MTAMVQSIECETAASICDPSISARSWPRLGYVETGDWRLDCATGRELGEELVAHMKEQRSPMALVTVARELARNGEWDGVLVGLFTAVGIELVGGRLRA